MRIASRQLLVGACTGPVTGGSFAFLLTRSSQQASWGRCTGAARQGQMHRSGPPRTRAVSPIASRRPASQPGAAVWSLHRAVDGACGTPARRRVRRAAARRRAAPRTRPDAAAVPVREQPAATAAPRPRRRPARRVDSQRVPSLTPCLAARWSPCAEVTRSTSQSTTSTRAATEPRRST